MRLIPCATTNNYRHTRHPQTLPKINRPARRSSVPSRSPQTCQICGDRRTWEGGLRHLRLPETLRRRRCVITTTRTQLIINSSETSKPPPAQQLSTYTTPSLPGDGPEDGSTDLAGLMGRTWEEGSPPSPSGLKTDRQNLSCLDFLDDDRLLHGDMTAGRHRLQCVTS